MAISCLSDSALASTAVIYLKPLINFAYSSTGYCSDSSCCVGFDIREIHWVKINYSKHDEKRRKKNGKKKTPYYTNLLDKNSVA